MKIGELIKQYREDQNLSQREFAERCSLSHATVSIIEKGINPQTGKEPRISFDTYSEIAKAMRISINDLFANLDDDTRIPWGSTITPVKDDNARLIYDASCGLSDEDTEIVLAMIRRLKGTK